MCPFEQKPSSDVCVKLFSTFVRTKKKKSQKANDMNAVDTEIPPISFAT